MSRAPRAMSRRKRRLFKLLTVAVSVLVGLGCVEVGLRLVGLEYQETTATGEYYSNPRGYFDVMGVRNGRKVYGIHDASIAGSDVRLPDALSLREAGAHYRDFLRRSFRVLGLGDSFTWGVGVRYEDTYLRRLERRLAAEGIPVGVRNWARSGMDLEQVCAAYLDLAARAHCPLVIYGFCLNDFGLTGLGQVGGLDYIDWRNKRYRPNPWRRRLAIVNLVAQLIENHRMTRITRQAYLDAFRGDNAESKFCLLRDLNARVTADRARLVILLFPLLHSLDDYPFAEIHDKLARFCREEEIPLLDLLPAFARHDTEDLWVHPSDHHPNEVAHGIAAEELYNFLKSEGLLDGLAPEGG